MSGNGSNEWGVPFGSIMFLDRVLRSHDNIEVLDRHDDIVFEVKRRKQGDVLRILCIEKYAASIADVRRAMQEFSPDVIYVGGKWNSATSEAQTLCDANKIGIYNAGEISLALRRDKYWNEARPDDDDHSAPHEESA